MAVVSIIVPVFNTEKYLNRCVDSLLNQIYKKIEVILVDDGSTDRSAKICDEYAVKDERVRVYHKENGGEATARNTGLSHANGKYIMFCDSDDEYLLDSIEKLVLNMYEENVDLVVSAYIEKKDEALHYACMGPQTFNNRAELMLYIFTDINPYGADYIMSTVNGKLFKTRIIKENDILFNQNFKIGNDANFICDYLVYCQKVFNIFLPTYVYYKYDITEHKQGTSWTHPDRVFLINYISNKRWQMISENADIEISKMSAFLQNYFDNIIRQLVRCAVYEDFFPNGLLHEIRILIKTKVIKEAICIYKRKRISDSRLIPFFFRHNLPKLLLFAIRHRAKRMLKKYGRAENIRMIYK